MAQTQNRYPDILKDDNPQFKTEAMDPATFEEIVITQFYGFYHLRNLQIGVEERIDIRSRIQDCLKKKIPRENKTTSGNDKRRSGANEALKAYHTDCTGDATSPKEKLKSTSGIPGQEKITKVYNKTYHLDAKQLLLAESVLTQEYVFDRSGWLFKNGHRMSHEEFVNLIRERLSWPRLTELRSAEHITHMNKTVNDERSNLRNTILLALKIVLGRTYSDMALGGERNNTEQNQKNHREAIVEFAIYTAILDAIYHKRYKTCGIKEVVEINALVPSSDDLYEGIEKLKIDAE